MLQIKSFVFNPFQENTYVVFDESKECAIIDPGCYDEHEREALISFIDSAQLKVKYLINTHCHIDHVLGNSFIKNRFNVKLLTHKQEEPVLRAVKTYASNYGFPGYEDSSIDQFIAEGDTLKIGHQSFEILFVPGHSPGHIALYHRESKSLLGGDVLFQNSIGRTDLPGGDFDTLISSIRHKFFALPEDVTVYCGHGPTTTIGFEKRTNPFCSVMQKQ